MWMPYRLGSCNTSCQKCGALHWLEERAARRAPGGEISTVAAPKFSQCCTNGAVVLPQPLDPPTELRELLMDQSDCQLSPCSIGYAYIQSVGKSRRLLMRNYNNALAFTSTGCKQDESVAGQLGVYSYKIQGRCHHLLGSILPPVGDQPKFAQVYFTGENPNERASIRQQHHFGRIETAMLVKLEQMIQRVNPFFAAFTTFKERAGDTTRPVLERKLLLLDPKNRDPRTYNRPTADEVVSRTHLAR